MEQLEFSRNDNCKLFLEFFSCIRLHDAEKFKTGNVLEIVLKGQVLGTAEVMAVKPFPFKNLNDVVAFLDNGKPMQYLAAAIKNMIPDVKEETLLDHVVLRYETRDLDAQATLLMSWWQDVYDLHKNLSPNKPAMHG